jgi:hypothetical protein
MRDAMLFSFNKKKRPLEVSYEALYRKTLAEHRNDNWICSDVQAKCAWTFLPLGYPQYDQKQKSRFNESRIHWVK